MAKMFYTLEEAAEKLGRDEQEVKELAARGQLQQFRDGDKLMFKREQVDSLAMSDTAVDLAADSGGPIPLADESGETDTISLAAEDEALPSPVEDTGQSTGISVFEADEVETADPGAQTQVTQPYIEDEELALDSVGSGSGLLDLTRESDDTSLGAELLDEIYPGNTEAGESISATAIGGSVIGGTSVGSSGVFETSAGTEQGMTAAGSSAFDSLAGAGAGGTAAGAETQVVEEVAPPATPAAPSAPVVIEAEGYDPAGSGFTAGMLFGAMVCLILGLIVAMSAIAGATSPVTDLMAGSSNTLLIWTGGLLVGCIVLGVVGMVAGKATAR